MKRENTNRQYTFLLCLQFACMRRVGCSVFKQKYLHFLCELLNAGFQYCEFSVSVRHYNKFPRKPNMIKYPCVASGSEFMIVRFVLFVVPQTLEPQIP